MACWPPRPPASWPAAAAGLAGGAAVTVVIAAENYPGPPVTGDVITGADRDGILHAGTRRRDDGAVVSAGGRVLSVVATGADLAAARADAYALVDAGATCAARTTGPTSPGRRRGPGPGPRHGLTALLRRRVRRRCRSRGPRVAPFHVMDVCGRGRASASAATATWSTSPRASPPPPRPAPVRAAAAKALDSEVLGYTVALGIPPLRAAIAGHYGRAYDLDVAPEDVVVTTGTSGGFLLAFLAAFDAGDRVAMARPGYPCYRNILTPLGCEVVELPCGPETPLPAHRRDDRRRWTSR